MVNRNAEQGTFRYAQSSTFTRFQLKENLLINRKYFYFLENILGLIGFYCFISNR